MSRALLAAPSGRIALLPEGEARIEKVNELEAQADGRKKTVTQYLIHGIGLFPSAIWLDEDQRFFASVSAWSSTVREGWKSGVPQLLASQERARAKRSADLASSLGHPLRGSWVVRGANLFDSERGIVLQRVAVLGAGNRIVAVGPEAQLKIPPGRALRGSGSAARRGSPTCYAGRSESDEA